MANNPRAPSPPSAYTKQNSKNRICSLLKVREENCGKGTTHILQLIHQQDRRTRLHCTSPAPQAKPELSKLHSERHQEFLVPSRSLCLPPASVSPAATFSRQEALQEALTSPGQAQDPSAPIPIHAAIQLGWRPPGFRNTLCAPLA